VRQDVASGAQLLAEGPVDLLPVQPSPRYRRHGAVGDCAVQYLHSTAVDVHDIYNVHLPSGPFTHVDSSTQEHNV